MMTLDEDLWRCMVIQWNMFSQTQNYTVKSGLRWWLTC